MTMNKRTSFKIGILALCTIGLACCKNESNDTGHGSHDHAPVGGKKYAEMVNEGKIQKDTMKSSPERYSMVLLKKTHVHLAYFSPGVKDRVIWGGLVPYGKVWVSGAHQATTLEINHGIKIQDKILEPGKYALFTIPQKDKWTIILNKNADQHLTDEYDEKLDALRFEVTPQRNERPVPRLTYTVETTSDTTGTITLEWEKIKITFPFSEV